jgi:hypothetical protein
MSSPDQLQVKIMVENNQEEKIKVTKVINHSVIEKFFF